VNATVFCNRGNIVGELWKVEKANLVPLSGAVESDSGSASPGTQNGDVHMFPLLLVGLRIKLINTQLTGYSAKIMCLEVCLSLLEQEYRCVDFPR
jgi:hypothetical protein